MGRLTVAVCLTLLLGLTSGPAALGEEARAVRGEPPHDTWFRSSDLIVATRSSAAGLVVQVAHRRARWHWRPLATLAPGGATDGGWTGYVCLTGGGRFAGAVVAPLVQSDVPAVRDRGATAYALDIQTGSVEPLFSGVALKYFNPSCGAGDKIAFTRHHGVDQAATEIIVWDAGAARVTQQFVTQGQLASTVPLSDAVLAARGSMLEIISRDGTKVLGPLPGQPFALRGAPGGADLLVADGAAPEASIWQLRGDRLERVGRGTLGETKLFPGADGRNVVVGGLLEAETSLVSVAAPTDQGVIASSLEGRVLLHPIKKAAAAAGSDTLMLSSSATGDPLHPLKSAIAAPLSTMVPEPLPVPELGVLRGFSPVDLLTASAFGAGDASTSYFSLNGADDEADGASAAAKCAVPRNHDRRQVPQPDAEQVNWALQMADRNLLKGSFARPANFLNMNLAAYSPSNDFPRRQLRGSTSVETPIPPSVIQAAFAQESAWRQATFRALPGVSGNPLVSDYYGAAGDINNIDYPNADCGYGLGQVTTPMTKSSGAYTANGKTKVAVDYAENAAASIQFLVDKWNELHAAGVTLNNADPTHLENWYFALWAYNTGFHADTGSGPWGLGWTNNPMNSDYPPDRGPFLRNTYADAEHPADWPYQERVFGWMETPLLDYQGEPSYEPPVYGSHPALHIPDRLTFCTASNECDPNYRDPTNQGKDFCTRADRQCWWHLPVTFVNDCLSQCAESAFTVGSTAPEPPGDDNYPPACSSSLPQQAVIVDDLPDSSLNVEGCAISGSGSNGTFEMNLGFNETTNDRLGLIDWHQLGGGFGGHTWFTKNRSSSSDTSHINMGRWTPNLPSGGMYNIKVHVPSTGASTTTARYTIHLGNGQQAAAVIDQHLHTNSWVSLGNFALSPGASVELSNLTQDPQPGTANVAFDAVAFVPVTGERVVKTVESVLVFDSYQRLDTDVPFSDDHPLQNMKSVFAWGNRLTNGVTTFTPCVIGTGPTCIGAATHRAFADWQREVTAGGNGEGVSWDNELLEKTQADWLALSNRRLGALRPEGLMDSPGAYKTYSRTRVEFMRDANAIVPGSVSLRTRHVTGDTHMPPFLIAIMKGIQTDYGVAPPDLRYSGQDLRYWNHASTSVDPLADGVLPGRAYMQHWKHDVSADRRCVRVKTISGGAIGYRAMIAQDYIRARAEAWEERVRQLVADGKAPQELLDAASSLRNVFFREVALWQPNAFSEASGYYLAPAIWNQQDFRLCADGSVAPGAVNVADSSYMPDLYIYVDGIAANLKGTLLACVRDRGCAAQRGDFLRFSHAPFFSGEEAWGFCDFSSNGVNRRNGNPWDLSWRIADDTPRQVKYCDENDPISAPD